MTCHRDPVTLPPGTSAPTGTPERYEAFDVLSGEMVLTRSHDREHPSAIVLPVIPR